LGGFEKRFPEVPADGIEKIDPRTATWPAPPLIVVISIILLYKDAELLRPLVDRIIIRALQVWVDDYDHLKRGMSGLT